MSEKSSDVFFYSISTGNIENTFDIEPDSGVIILAQSLDFESGLTSYKVWLLISGKFLFKIIMSVSFEITYTARQIGLTQFEIKTCI